MTPKDAPTFASLLTSYLEASGISVRGLAKLLATRRRGDGKQPTSDQVETARRGLSRYLAGTNTPRPDTASEIADVLGLPGDAFAPAFPPGEKRRSPRDQITEIKDLIAELTQAIGAAEGPEAETIRGLLGELAGKVAKVQSATTKTTRDLKDLRTRVERLEARHVSAEAQPKDRAA